MRGVRSHVLAGFAACGCAKPWLNSLHGAVARCLRMDLLLIGCHGIYFSGTALSARRLAVPSILYLRYVVTISILSRYSTM